MKKQKINSKIDQRQFLDEETLESLLESREGIAEVADKYTEELKSPDPKQLERLKRELLGYYSNYSFRMAKVYAKKSGNHIFYEDYKRQLRFEHMKDMMDEAGKIPITRAEKEVEAYPAYVSDLLVLEDMRKALIEFERIDKFCSILINAITQSIAVVRRDTDSEY